MSKNKYDKDKAVADYKAFQERDKHKEQLQKDLGSIEFDENRVAKSVSFAQFIIHNTKTYAIGLNLTEWHDNKDKKGVFVGRVQTSISIIITSDREYHKRCFKVRGNASYKHNIKFNTVPDNLPLRWDLARIEDYLLNDPVSDGAQILYERLKARYNHYVYVTDEEWYIVHALWDMATYFHSLFRAFPIFELRGIKGTAKTKIMEISREHSFNATPILVNPSAPTLFRETEANSPTTYIDEAEKLFRFYKGQVEEDDRVELLNAGYRQGAKVGRQEKVGNRFKTVYYSVYSPKMVASINGLYGALESRAITHIQTRAPDTDERGERDVDPDDETWQDLRNQLYLFMFENWQEVRDYYQEMLKKNPTSLRKRDYQLWLPLLCVAKVIENSVYERVVAFAEKQAYTKQVTDVSQDSWEYRLLQAFYSLLKQGKMRIHIKDVQEEYGDDAPASRQVSKIVNKMGLLDYYHQFRDGMGWEIPLGRFRELIHPAMPLLFAHDKESDDITTLSTHSTQQPKVLHDKIEKTPVKKREVGEAK